MLGRRQLRAKAMQALYAYYRGNKEVNLVEKNMIRGVYDVEKLYHALLTFILSLKNEAEKKVEIGRNKNFPTEEELNPNLKFIENRVFEILENSVDLKEFMQKNKQLDWQVEEVYPAKIFREIQEDNKFKKYMLSEETSLEEDKKILIHIFSKYVAQSTDLEDFLEDHKLSWSDDLHIANTMVLNTLKSFTEKERKLFSLLLDEEHLEFTKDLVRQCVHHETELTQIIEEKANNWDFDRIALIDRIILQMALAEFLYFPSIPPKVTINEYVEIAKNYSTDKSKTFVNGILDKTLKDFTEAGKIRKSARGMM